MCEFSRTWSDDLSRPCLHQQLLPVQVLDGKLAATECLADRYLLVHPQVDAGSLEERVIVFLEDDNDIACITVRLGRGRGRGRDGEGEGGEGEGGEGEGW